MASGVARIVDRVEARALYEAGELARMEHDAAMPEPFVARQRRAASWWRFAASLVGR